MRHEIKATWKEELKFDVFQNNNTFKLDGDSGGTDYRPKALMLSALAGCSGMDVSMLMRKMRATPDSLEIKVVGHLTDTQPKVYDHVIISYYFTGEHLKTAKLIKAINMSLETYCGISEMFKKFATLETEIFFNGQLYVTPTDLK